MTDTNDLHFDELVCTIATFENMDSAIVEDEDDDYCVITFEGDAWASGTKDELTAYMRGYLHGVQSAIEDLTWRLSESRHHLNWKVEPDELRLRHGEIDDELMS